MEPIINPHNELPVGAKRNIPRDVFLHLLGIVALYWSAISVITLCWQYINYFFPQALDYNYGFSGSVRFAVSSLIIMVPVFLLTSWFLNKIYAKESAVRESKIRKWLIYLTLFITALVIIGDLIFAVNTFLGGEITVRFILKALVILVVAAKIFWYYLDDVRRPSPSPWNKYVAIEIAAIVLVLVVGAFFIIGSPKTARLQQQDMQRVSDLQNIQWQVVNYWQRKEVLPVKLSDLADSISDYTISMDPVTGQSYAYSVKDATALAFELCATFDLASANNGTMAPVPAKYPGESMTDNWTHPAGYYCFERTIDRQLYPPLPR